VNKQTARDLTQAVAEVESLKLRLTALENVLQFRDPALFAAYSAEIANLESGKPHQMHVASLQSLQRRLESE
jgi:hypothetical protein